MLKSISHEIDRQWCTKIFAKKSTVRQICSNNFTFVLCSGQSSQGNNGADSGLIVGYLCIHVCDGCIQFVFNELATSALLSCSPSPISRLDDGTILCYLLLCDATGHGFKLELRHLRQMLCLFNAKGFEACLTLISLWISIQRRYNTNVT